MASKQLYELDPVTLPLKDDDLVLVSQKSVAENINFSRKATVSNIASKVQENVATQIDNAKYQIQLECDNKFANKIDYYSKVEVDAMIAMVDPSINYLTRTEAGDTYVDMYSYNQQISLINSELQGKLAQSTADQLYATKNTTYTKTEVDSKIDALSDDFPKKDEVCTIDVIDSKIEQLQNVYAAKDAVYTTAAVDNALSSLSSELTSLIDNVSPFRIKTFINDSEAIAVEDGAINFIGMYENNQLAITLPPYNAEKLAEFYVIVDNSSHNGNVQFGIVPHNGTKIVSTSDQCFEDVPSWKIGYLHFKQIANEYVLKVDRSDLVVVINVANQTESEQQDSGAESTEPQDVGTENSD